VLNYAFQEHPLVLCFNLQDLRTNTFLELKGKASLCSHGEVPVNDVQLGIPCPKTKVVIQSWCNHR
jgi:hypothetical protein